MEDHRIHIAIASGKGGTGKTTLATNLSVALARKGMTVTYADCDVEEPNGHLFLPPDPEKQDEISVMIPVVDETACNSCGICAAICEFNALAVMAGKFLVFPSLCHGCGACVALCPERALSDGLRPIGLIHSGPVRGLSFIGGNLNVGEAQAPPLIKAIKKRIADTKLAILDAPPGTSCPVIEAVRGADYVVLVTEPTPFGLNDLRLAVSMLREIQIPFGVVINRCDIGNSLVKDYCETEALTILAELPFSRDVARAYASGHLAIDLDKDFENLLLNLFEKIHRETANVRTGSSER
ncbi:MAG TPA: ATP-binding protein [candidate division Zixibacteria bacterium]|nr:ATP-binding protein [candidate division Zixibacteria bacterium]